MPLFTDPPAPYPYPAGEEEYDYCIECGEEIADGEGLCPYCQLQLDAEREELAHPKRTRR